MNTSIKGMKEMNGNLMLTGIFGNREDAKKVYFNLLNLGYREDDINLFIIEENHSKHAVTHETEVNIDADLSKKIGIVAGIIAGIILSAGLVIIGFKYGGLAGAGVAGAIGTIIGMMVGSESSKESVNIATQEIANDGIIIGVNPRNKEDAGYLEKDWKTNKGKMLIAVR